MQVVITAVGPDNRGLADPIVHSVTGLDANIAEIQMYDHDAERVFSMLTRVELDVERYEELCNAMAEVARRTKLSIRTWTPDIVGRKPRLAICVTYRPEPALALLRAIRDGQIKAEPRLMIGNRETCRGLAEQFDLPWFNVGDKTGSADDERMIAALRRARSRLHRARPVHANSAGGELLEVRRRADHQPAPRTAAELSRHEAVSRCLRQPDADLSAARATSSCRSSTRAIRSSTSRRSWCRPACRSRKSSAAARRTTSRIAWSRACAGRSKAKCGCTSTGSWWGRSSAHFRIGLRQHIGHAKSTDHFAFASAIPLASGKQEKAAAGELRLYAGGWDREKSNFEQHPVS